MSGTPERGSPSRLSDREMIEANKREGRRLPLGVKVFFGCMGVALAASVVMFVGKIWLTARWVEAWGIRGQLAEALAQPDGPELFVLERIEEGTATTSIGVVRITRLDAATGRTAGKPCVFERLGRVLGPVGGLLIADLGRNPVAAIDPVTCRPSARFDAALAQTTKEVELHRDRRGLLVTLRDGRPGFIDGESGKLLAGVSGERLVPLPARPFSANLAGGAELQVSSPGPRGRVEIGGRAVGPEYILPALVLDHHTGEAVGPPAGALLMHHTEVAGHQKGLGVVLSFIAPDGTERWRRTVEPTGDWLPVRHAYKLKGRAVLVLATPEDHHPVVVALDLATGAVAWRRDL